MPTQAQIDANRGKARASRNRLSHGLTSAILQLVGNQLANPKDLMKQAGADGLTRVRGRDLLSMMRPVKLHDDRSTRPM